MTSHDETPIAAARPRAARTTAVRWLRKGHGWIGLWGAMLGLLFGTSGIWLNHRNLLQLPPVAQQRSASRLALPVPAPRDAQALAVWLQRALALPAVATSVKTEPARPAPWAEAGAASRPDVPVPMQPERWTVIFGGPDRTVQAELWLGNGSVGVRRTENGAMATLMNLHKGSGMTIPWILLVDTLAGSLILLSLSGLALWLLTHRRRTVGWLIFGASAASVGSLVAMHL